MTEKNSMGIQLVLFGAKFLSRYTVASYLKVWHLRILGATLVLSVIEMITAPHLTPLAI